LIDIKTKTPDENRRAFIWFSTEQLRKQILRAAGERP
jgi:hypothetical protein